MCARATAKYPDGRTGTVNGYVAHRRAGELACEPCKAAQTSKCRARLQRLSREELERDRRGRTDAARRRREAGSPCAGRKGTLAGHAAHIAAGQVPCGSCRKALAAYETVCARPTRKYPNGRTGTRPGYMAHIYAKQSPCDACVQGHNATVASDKAADPDGHLRGNLWNKYRLTLEAYRELLDAQDGKCAICRVDSPTDIRTSRFHVDHDHACCPGRKSCGKCTRGLLCHACNTGLGNFGDDPERLIAAASYVLTASHQ